jgi:hypothetical protein
MVEKRNLEVEGVRKSNQRRINQRGICPYIIKRKTATTCGGVKEQMFEGRRIWVKI